MCIEIFPAPLSPVFLSLVEPIFKGMLDYTFDALGFELPEDLQVIGSTDNKLCLNRDDLSAAFLPLSLAVRETLVNQIVDPFEAQGESTRFELSLPFFRMAYRILRFMIRFPRQLPGMLASYRSQITDVEEYPYALASDQEICGQIYRLPFEYASRLFNHDFLMASVIGGSYRVLGAMLRRFYQADTGEVVAKLTSGASNHATIETNKRLWDLAQIARSAPAVSAVLREYDSAQARVLLRNSREGREFIRAMDRFFDEFGHHAVHMDILYPTWGEDPEPVYALVRGYLDTDESHSPYLQGERLTRESERLTRMVFKDVERNILRRIIYAPILKWLLDHIQFHIRERDKMHFEMTRLFPPLRRLLFELGDRWAGRGLLDKSEDIFFLRFDEITAMAKSPHPAQGVVRPRRNDFQYAQGHPSPNGSRSLSLPAP